jgi:hypothetical protein
VVGEKLPGDPIPCKSPFKEKDSIPCGRRIDKISEIEILEEKFKINEQYNPNDEQMKKILFRIERE